MTTWLCLESSMLSDWPVIGRMETLCLTCRWHHFLFPGIVIKISHCSFTNVAWLPVSPQRASGLHEGGRVINSVLEGDVAVATGAVVQHCHLQVRTPLLLFSQWVQLQGFMSALLWPLTSYQGPLEVPSGCLLSGLESSTSSCVRQLQLAGDIIIQGHRIELGELKLKVYTVTGAQDDLEVKKHKETSNSL